MAELSLTLAFTTERITLCAGHFHYRIWLRQLPFSFGKKQVVHAHGRALVVPAVVKAEDEQKDSQTIGKLIASVISRFRFCSRNHGTADS